MENNHPESTLGPHAPEPPDRISALAQAPAIDVSEEAGPVAEEPPQSGRWAQLAARLRKSPQSSREAKSGERTRGM
jgi:hypothetical protein